MKTHDYTNRGWGHDYFISKVLHGGNKLRAGGWGRGLKKGDYIILPNEGKTTRYEIESIEYKTDPSDMWFAWLEFSPRQIT